MGGAAGTMFSPQRKSKMTQTRVTRGDSRQGINLTGKSTETKSKKEQEKERRGEQQRSRVTREGRHQHHQRQGEPVSIKADSRNSRDQDSLRYRDGGTEQGADGGPGQHHHVLSIHPLQTPREDVQSGRIQLKLWQLDLNHSHMHSLSS